MEIKGCFKGTSFEFEEKSLPKILSDLVQEDEGIFYNKPDLLFEENKYIEETIWFSKIIDKFKIKNFDENLKIFREDKLQKIGNYSEEVKRYSKVIFENNIKGLNQKDISISVKHFEIYEQSDKINYVQNIYILLFLANDSSFEENQFTFKIKFEGLETKKEVDFDQVTCIELNEFYDWIVSSSENLETRLKIVRKLILRKDSFDLNISELESAKSMFNRIINEETDKYFEQINILKDDFLRLSENKQASYKSLHIKFLGWLSSMGLFIYGEVKGLDTKDLFEKLIFSHTQKIQLFLIIFLIALILIWFVFAKEINSNKKEYEKIKSFYIKHLFFYELDFNNYLSVPEIGLLYKNIFCGLILGILIRIIL